MTKKKSTAPQGKDKELDPRILLIAQKLKELRKASGHSNYETFAWDSGIGRMQYWRMEKGNNFTFSSLLKILDAHQISLAEFFSDFVEVGASTDA